jgi:hypothetical protein
VIYFLFLQGKMDGFNTGIREFSVDDIELMDNEELCEYLSSNGLDPTGSRSELLEKFRLFLEKITTEPKLSASFDYRHEMNMLKDIVVRIKNQNFETSDSDMKLLEESAKEIMSRMPMFMPKYPGFHQYEQRDLIAQAYIQYLPKEFHREKFVAIRTNPNGRKCP